MISRSLFSHVIATDYTELGPQNRREIVANFEKPVIACETICQPHRKRELLHRVSGL